MLSTIIIMIILMEIIWRICICKSIDPKEDDIMESNGEGCSFYEDAEL